MNKPKGITSHAAVTRVRRALGVRKAGHAGTLDPEATGVLLVCLGRATKLFEALQGHTKEYLATVHLGVQTDTYDAAGTVLAERPVPTLSREAIEQLLETFRGEIEQKPPPFSALKYRGRPLYEFARKGIAVPIRPRRVRIEEIELLDWDPPKLRLRIVCGRGTYVRSLAHEIGERLGCGGHLSQLVRTRSGPFRIEESIALAEVEADPEQAKKRVVPVDRVRAWLSENLDSLAGKES